MSMIRRLSRRISARPSSDGDGVRIQRIGGREVSPVLDPFLLLDEIRSEEGRDYIGGFPPHPHRGFETVTYLLNGRMRHEDHLGNRGLLTDGGVQWMTAGRGIIHSEMPEQTDGLMHGFQLWLNLPAARKMQPAGYRDYDASELPRVDVPGGEVVVIAGAFGGVTSPVATGTTEPLYLDLRLDAGARLEVPVPAQQQALLYVYGGGTVDLDMRQMGAYTNGDTLAVEAGPEGVRALLIAGTPLREPVHQYGPFVMNSMAEIEQAIDDYNSGRLTAA